MMNPNTLSIPIRKCSLLILFFIFAISIQAQKEKLSKPRNYVTDDAAILTPGQLSDLNAKLKAFENTTTNQIFVYIDASLKGRDLEMFTNQLFKQWQVGQKGKDNGVLITIFTNDHKFRIETGYGLEGVLPDLVTKKIQDEFMRPYFKQDAYYEGINAGIDQLIAKITGVAVTATVEESTTDSISQIEVDPSPSYEVNPTYEEPEYLEKYSKGQVIASVVAIVVLLVSSFFLIRSRGGRRKKRCYLIGGSLLAIFPAWVYITSVWVNKYTLLGGFTFLSIFIFLFALTYRSICKGGEDSKMGKVCFFLSVLILSALSLTVFLYVSTTFQEGFSSWTSRRGINGFCAIGFIISVLLWFVTAVWASWDDPSSGSSGSDDNDSYSSSSSSSDDSFSGGGGGRSGGGGSSSDW